MQTENFIKFLVSRKYKAGGSGLPVLLPPKPVDSPSEIEDYKTRLELLTASPDWYEASATIGRPLGEPHNCWITTDAFGNVIGGPTYGDDEGTAARDLIGLVDCPDGQFLLRLEFGASYLHDLPDHEVARPLFSDLGNRRFTASQSSVLASSFAAAGWGATVHLGKFLAGSFSDITGASERVCTSLPISVLRDLKVTFLGRVNATRGIDGAIDDDNAFAEALLNGRTHKDIRENLLSLLAP